MSNIMCTSKVRKVLVSSVAETVADMLIATPIIIFSASCELYYIRGSLGH